MDCTSDQAVRPALLIADEITSALDASIQFEILNLVEHLQRELGFGCVFITHNLGVAARMCDAVSRLFPGADPEPAAVETCLYTNTDDERFVLERHGRVVVGSACSGHAFKFAPVVGERLAELATR